VDLTHLDGRRVRPTRPRHPRRRGTPSAGLPPRPRLVLRPGRRRVGRGGGIETALGDAASIGNSWAFSYLRRGLDGARRARETPWAALGRLGQELGIGELSELAASVALAGTEGAKVRASLAAKAASLRTHELAEAETADQAATERMSLPIVMLFAGFLFFIGFPAVERVLTGSEKAVSS